MKNASLVIAAGSYPEAEARRALGQAPYRPGGCLSPTVQVPPGVDTERFRPLPQIERASARARLGLPGPVPSYQRQPPSSPQRDGHPDRGGFCRRRALPRVLRRHRRRGQRPARLQRLAGHAKAKVDLLGKLSDSDLADFYACADVFALCCRSRWWGLEEEGFGIVLVEAAAAGVPCITINSGGAGEAVRHGKTGVVVNMADRRSGARRARHWHVTATGRRPTGGRGPGITVVQPRPSPANG